MATVLAVCISENKGERKKPVESVELRENHGIVGDGHAGDWHRQVSLLAQESIDKMRALGLDVNAGDFAENITTSGIDLVCAADRQPAAGRRDPAGGDPDRQGVSHPLRHLLPGRRLRHAQGGDLCQGHHRRSCQAGGCGCENGLEPYRFFLCLAPHIDG